MITTNVPGCAFGPTGFYAPAETAVLTGVLADYQSAFGGNLNLALTTPQGQLCQSTTAIIGQTDSTFVYYTNQVDPAYASGRMQDAIGRIYFMTRKPALSTVVACVCTGLASVVIPQGTLAQDLAGNTYYAIDGGTIGAGGTVTLNFANAIPGPTPCAANTLTIIAQAIANWDSINNPADGALGQLVESRAAFEERRQESVASNSRNTVYAIQGAVLALSGVLDAFTYSNNTASPVTYRGKSIAANSVYCCALGGTDADVADAIWRKGPPGIPTDGNTAVTVYDTNPSYSAPYPSYTINFQRPSTLTVYFAVNIANGPTVPADAASQIQTAIINAFSGSDGGVRARIGATLYASNYAATIKALGSWVNVITLFMGSVNTKDASFTATISTTVMTVSAVASGALQVDDIVAGSGVTEGTYIVNQLTGIAGGTGTYTVSVSQTVSGATAMTATPVNQDLVSVNIDQAPATSAPDIVVTVT